MWQHEDDTESFPTHLLATYPFPLNVVIYGNSVNSYRLNQPDIINQKDVLAAIDI